MVILDQCIGEVLERSQNVDVFHDDDCLTAELKGASEATRN
jgi:hypothetical protein